MPRDIFGNEPPANIIKQLEVEHLLLALINQKERLTTQLFLNLGASDMGAPRRMHK